MHCVYINCRRKCASVEQHRAYYASLNYKTTPIIVNRVKTEKEKRSSKINYDIIEKGDCWK
jgi:hypothetical protein